MRDLLAIRDDILAVARFNCIIGTNASETLVGTGLSETLNGLGGADFLRGGGGRDFIIGGDGSGDRMWGGAGVDCFHFNPTSGRDFIYDFNRGRDFIELQGFGPIELDDVNVRVNLEGTRATVAVDGFGGFKVQILGTHLDTLIDNILIT